jgi:hypothetical protein
MADPLVFACGTVHEFEIAHEDHILNDREH